LPAGWKLIYTANTVRVQPVDNRFVWVGKISSAWNTSANWLGNRAPGAGQSIVLPTTGVIRELVVNIGATTGSVEIETGRTLTITNGGILTATNTLINHGKIKGTGKIVHTHFTNSGTIAPGDGAGLLNVAGNFTNAGKIEVEIAGTDAGVSHDQLSVTGSVNLGGNLVIANINGFKMAPGQSFIILTGRDIKGQFATVSWPAGVAGTVTYSAATVTLNVTTAPGVTSQPTSLNISNQQTRQLMRTDLSESVHAGVTLAPVPANSFVTLSLTDQSLIGQQAQVYNVSGNAVIRLVITGNNTRIDIGNLPAGVYMVKIQTRSYRFIKQ
jgi:hypothetical protein